MIGVRCVHCPLRLLPLFLSNEAEETALVQSFKQRELRFHAGELVIQEGQKDASLFMLLHGWAYRSRPCANWSGAVCITSRMGACICLTKLRSSKRPIFIGRAALVDRHVVR